MPASDLRLILALALAVSLSHCKTTQATSSAKASSAQDGLVWRKVWADGIEQVIPPAKTLPPVAANMTGVWYCRAESCGKGQLGLTRGTVIMSLQGSSENADGTLSFDVNGPSAYAFDRADWVGVADMAPNTYGKSSIYTMVFTDDKHGELISKVIAPYPPSTTGGPNDKNTWFTFTWVEDGHWLRQTMEKGVMQPDYDLLRIVDADGRRTARYDLYLADLAAKVAAKGVSADAYTRQLWVSIDAASDLGKGAAIPREGGRLVADDPAGADSASGRDSADHGGTDSSNGSNKSGDGTTDGHDASGRR